MRTALVLLFLLAAGSVLGSIIPQEPISPDRVVRYMTAHPFLGPLLAKAGMFNVFGSAWFTAIYVALGIALVGCLVPRIRAHLRVLRAKPPQAPKLHRYQNHVLLRTKLSAQEAGSVGRRALRRRHFRTATYGSQVAGEKGYLREAGSIVFHVSILVLLLAIGIGKGFGFRGQFSIIQGQRWADARIDYTSYSEGRFFHQSDLPPFLLQLDRFQNTFYSNGTPKAYNSTLTALAPSGRVLAHEVVHPNGPMTVDGVRIFQVDYGYAPVIRVTTASGRVVQNGPVLLLRSARTEISSGAVKITNMAPQVGLQVTFFTGLQVLGTQGGQPQIGNNPSMTNPMLVVLPFVGNLSQNLPQSMFDLNTTHLTPMALRPLLLRPGQSLKLPDGATVQFQKVLRYSVFSAGRQPTLPVIATSAFLLLGALIPALYSRRRRIWIETTATEEGAVVELAGIAMQGKLLFSEEFEKLVDEVSKELGPPPESQEEPERTRLPAGSRPTHAVDGGSGFVTPD